MKYPLNVEVGLVSEKLLNKQNVLLFGNIENTSKVLEKTYEDLSKNKQFLCSFHNASRIKSALNFFIPILKLKYKDNSTVCEKLIDIYLKLVSQKNDETQLFHIAEVCGQDLKGKTENEKKLPIIFINGIEKLLAKIDFPNLHKKDYKQTNDLNFGNCLRGDLHQTGKAIFCGTVIDYNSLEYKATLANGARYMFYCGNFATVHIE